MPLSDARATLHETVTPSQAKELIRCLAQEQSVLLLSPPGAGKSDVVRQAAADAKLPCKSLPGTQIAPEDVSGVPRIVGERSVFCPPRVPLPENAAPPCLFLGELPACTPDVQKAFYSLLLERRLGEFRLPRGRAGLAGLGGAVRRAGRDSRLHPIRPALAVPAGPARAGAVLDAARLGDAVARPRPGRAGGARQRHRAPGHRLRPAQPRGRGLFRALAEDGLAKLRPLHDYLLHPEWLPEER